MGFPNGHALLIGVGSYIHHEAVTNLPNTVEDVRQLAAILTDPQICGYPNEQVMVLHDDQATREGVLAALDHLVETTTPESMVFIYYAGHGHYDAPAGAANRTYFLTTHETDLTSASPTTTEADLTPERWVVPKTALSQNALLTVLERLPAERVLLLFNACYSGELHPLTMGPAVISTPTLQGSNPPEPLAAALLGTGSGRVIITACRDSQVAQAGPGPTTIFAEYLLDALQGKDVPSRNGTISVFDLYLAVYEKAKARVLDRYYRHQEPVLTMLRGVGPFPVALYQGATHHGIADTAAAPPPAGDTVRLISLQHSQQALATLLGRMDQKLDQLRRQIERLDKPASPSLDPRVQAQVLLDTMPINRVPTIAPPPPGSRVLHVPDPHFVGRNTDLKELAKALKGNKRVALGPRAATTGLGGIGKTSLAIEFVHRYGIYFAGGVFWLSFADASAIPGEIADCGGLGRLELHPTFSDLKLDDQVRLVQAAWQKDTPRLLIVDNCEDQELAQQWLPKFGGCRVLITSRRQQWSSSLRIEAYGLDILPRKASIALLRQLARHLKPSEANEIAAELGDLPLALHMAGSFLARYESLAISTYLQQLQDQVLLDHPCFQGRGSGFSPTQHDLHVGRTFALSYDRLDRTSLIDRLARQFLAIMAWLAPGKPIPSSLVLSVPGLTTDDLDGSDALLRLCELGLINTVGTGQFSIHRLVQAFIQSLPVAATQQELIEECLAAAAFHLNEAGYPEAMQSLLPHLRWMTRQRAMRKDQGMANLCSCLGYHLNSIGDYDGARPMFEYSLAIREQTLGPTHPATVQCLNSLASLLDYSEARPLYERALAICEQTQGPTHPNTAQYLNNLATLVHATGDYSAARPLYERALAICEQTLGPTSPKTAQCLNNLASLMHTTGDYSAARPLFERALAICEQTLGPTHPKTAQSLNNLASLVHATGDYSAARPLYERALDIKEQTLGPTHPDTAQSLNNLASLVHATGDYSAARPLYERALAIREQTLGSTHPDTATSLNNLAALLDKMADYSAARPLLERALAINEQVLGPTHPATATCLANLGAQALTTGDYSAARPLLERALAINEQVLGPAHPDTAQCLNNLAALAQATGDYGAARPLYERVLTIREELLGLTHPKTEAIRKKLDALNTVGSENDTVWREP